MKWFKNITLFELLDTKHLNYENISKMLLTQSFIPCDKKMASSQGWVAPFPEISKELVFKVNDDYLFICLKTEEKIVPSNVVNEKLLEQVLEIEKNNGKRPNKKELIELKEMIYNSLLPQAFSKTHTITGYIDLKNNFLVLDNVSAVKSENFTIIFRKALTTFQIRLPNTLPIEMILTNWLKTQNPSNNFKIHDNCTLVDALEEGGQINCKKQDLDSLEILKLLDTRQAIQLSVLWSDNLSFSIDVNLIIKSIKFKDIFQDENKESVNIKSYTSNDIMLMLNTFDHLFNDLKDTFFKN